MLTYKKNLRLNDLLHFPRLSPNLLSLHSVADTKLDFGKSVKRKTERDEKTWFFVEQDENKSVLVSNQLTETTINQTVFNACLLGWYWEKGERAWSKKEIHLQFCFGYFKNIF